MVKGDELEIATDDERARCRATTASVDGALGAELLGAFKTLIEDPVPMLV